MEHPGCGRGAQPDGPGRACRGHPGGAPGRQARLLREAPGHRLSPTAGPWWTWRADRVFGWAARPDTFLGAGLQTCRALLDAGAIGTPLAANAFFHGAGPESWHPNPEFFYKRGAGPLFDVGVYYLTALVALLGPVNRITGSARISRPRRQITSQPLAGTWIDVEVPTHVGAVAEHESGPVTTLVASFDVPATRYRFIEIYGTEATLSVPDPNTFGGPVQIRRNGDTDWTDMPLTHANAVAEPGHRSRGHGARGARAGRTARPATSRSTCWSSWRRRSRRRTRAATRRSSHAANGPLRCRPVSQTTTPATDTQHRHADFSCRRRPGR